MIRLSLRVSFLLILLIIPVFAQSKTETRSSMIELCFDLWKRSSFGWDEKQTERAAWLVRDPDGTLKWVDWPNPPLYRAAEWDGPPPEGVIAQLHTHPNFADPEPSKQDVRVATETKVSVYVISGAGIWRVHPDGKIVKEADDKWHRKMKKKK